MLGCSGLSERSSRSESSCTLNYVLEVSYRLGTELPITYCICEEEINMFFFFSFRFISHKCAHSMFLNLNIYFTIIFFFKISYNVKLGVLF